MADREAAARLKRELRVAMESAGIPDYFTLAALTGVSHTTIENWIYGKTVPQASKLRVVGDALRPFTSPADLEAAYAGLPPTEPPLVDVLRQLAPDLHELVVLLRAQADQQILEAVRSALEARRRQHRVSPDEPSVEASEETDDEP